MSWYQQGAFLVKGLREFTKDAYIKAAKSFGAKDLEKDLSGLVYMITGANSGLGKAAALNIATKGGEVHMICRNKERGESALEEIKNSSNNSNVHLHILDLSETEEVFKFANDFSQSHENLNVLINNCGCMVLERKFNKNGVELNFATNTLGTYVLTEQLLGLLTKSQQPRVVTVSSGGMYTSKLTAKIVKPSESGTFDGRNTYAQNKRQQVVLTGEWAKLHPGIHFSCMHPGWADTPAVQTSMPDFYATLKNKLRTAEQGADTIVWLSVSDDALNQPSGLFYLDRQPVKSHLIFAWTRESEQDRKDFLQTLSELSNNAKSEV